MENAYKNSIMVGKFPSCVLNIKVRPEVVDVNVHPAKTQVRFSDERKVSSAVYFAVKSAIESFDAPLQVDLSKAVKATEKARPTAVQLEIVEDDEPQKSTPVITSKPAVNTQKAPQTVPTPKKDFWGSMNSEQYRSGTLSEPKSKFDAPIGDNPDFIHGFKKKQTENVQSVSVSKADAQDKKAHVQESVPVEPLATDKPQGVRIQEQQPQKPKPLRLLGEAFKTYIICEYDGRVVLIDKHAAHERIIYNKMKKEAEKGVSSQVLLAPVTVTLSKGEYDVILSNLDVFKKAGYLIEDFGAGVVIVRECPMLISGDDIEDTVIEIASYHTSACKAAIKAGYKNSTAEMKVLAEQVLYDNDVRYCPHGRPVLIELTKYEIEKLFGRIQ